MAVAAPAAQMQRGGRPRALIRERQPGQGPTVSFLNLVGVGIDRAGEGI